MAEQKFYIGSYGPFLFDDTDLIDDPDGDFAGLTQVGLATSGDVRGADGYFTNMNLTGDLDVSGAIIAGAIKLDDLNDTHTLAIVWNENDTANRLLDLYVNGGDRELHIEGDVVVDQDYSVDADVDFNSLTCQSVVFPTVLIDQNYPTGVTDRAESTPAFDNGTRTYSLTPTGANFSFYVDGIKFVKTVAQSKQISDDEGMHYLYFDGTGALAESTVFNAENLFENNAYVAAVYWNTTSNIQIMLIDERHGCRMPGKTHRYLHYTNHTALESGGALGDILPDDPTPDNTNGQFSVTETKIWDEDSQFTLTAKGSTDNIAVYYRDGADASNIWKVVESASFGVLTAGGAALAYYNKLTAGTWSRTAIANLNFVLAHVFAFNDTTRKFGVIMGQAEYTSIADARVGAVTEVSNLYLHGLPFPEIKFLGTVIYQSANGYSSSAVYSRIRTTDTGDDYVDLRNVTYNIGTSSATVVDHGALSGLADDDHIQYSLVDGTRAFTGTVAGIDPVDPEDLATKNYVDSLPGGPHDRLHAMTDVLDHSAGDWKLFYSDGDGEIQELAFGDANKVLTSNGAAAAPTWEAAGGAGVTNPLELGTDDSDPGIIYLYGGGAGEDGGVLRFYLGADDDASISYFIAQIVEDDFLLGPDTDTDAIKLDALKNLYLTDGDAYIQLAGVTQVFLDATNAGIFLGIDDTKFGFISLYGHTTGEHSGGAVNIYLSADYDAAYHLWTIKAYDDALYFGQGGVDDDIIKISADKDLYITAGTISCSDLTDGYIPYHVSDAVGLANSVIQADTTYVGIACATTIARLEVSDSGSPAAILVKITADDGVPYAFIMGNDTYSAVDYTGFRGYMANDGAMHIEHRVNAGNYLPFTLDTGELAINGSSTAAVAIATSTFAGSSLLTVGGRITTLSADANAVLLRGYPTAGSGKNFLIDLYSESDIANSPTVFFGLAPTAGWAHNTLAGAFLWSAKTGGGTNQNLDLGSGGASYVGQITLIPDANVGFFTGATTPVGAVEIEDNATAQAMLLKITQDNEDVYGLVIGNDTYSATDTNALKFKVMNTGAIAITWTAGDFTLGLDADTDALKLDSSKDLYLTDGDLYVQVGGTTTVKLDATNSIIMAGVIATTPGTLRAYGAATLSAIGGKVAIYPAADHDGTINYYQLHVYEDDLYIGPDGDTDALKLDALKDLYLTDGDMYVQAAGVTAILLSAATSPHVVLGVEDTVSGYILCYGHAAGSSVGGLIELQAAADYDGTIVGYRVRAYDDYLAIGSTGDLDMIKLVVAGDVYFTAGSLVIKASEYINFGATLGSGGYGFRDNAGQMEMKDSGGAWTDISGLSDLRFKKDVEDYSLGLDFILKLQPKQFAWTDTDKNYGDRKHTGLVAQDVKKVIDELDVDFGGWVEYANEQKTQVLDYKQFIMVLINAVKEQQVMLDALKE